MKRIVPVSKPRVMTAYVRQGVFLSGLEKVLQAQLESLGEKEGKTSS